MDIAHQSLDVRPPVVLVDQPRRSRETLKRPAITETSEPALEGALALQDHSPRHGMLREALGIRVDVLGDTLDERPGRVRDPMALGLHRSPKSDHPRSTKLAN